MSTPHALDRRAFMAYFSGLGLGGTLFPGVLWARLQDAQAITADLLDEAEKVAGLEFTEDERELMVGNLNRNLEGFKLLRAMDIPNQVRPALSFDPAVPASALPTDRGPLVMSRAAAVRRPANLDALAFRPVTELAELVRTRQVTATELTRMYIARLKRHGPTLECVIELTEERALRQAAEADREIAAGRYRGPLHGIPWGAKDLLAVRDYRTTWGAKPYEDQRLDEDATVVQRLDAAGAVLVAKLTLGALAMGGRLVRRDHEEPVEPGAGLERIVRGVGRGDGRRAPGLRDRQRDVGVDRLARHALRGERAPTDVRLGKPRRRHDPVVEHGQTRPVVPHGGRLRAGDGRDSRPRRQGPHGPRRRLQLGRHRGNGGDPRGVPCECVRPRAGRERRRVARL